MSQHINAIYENGVLRPLSPIELQEREVVSARVSRSLNNDESSGDWAPTLFEILDGAGLIGCINGGPHVLSTNSQSANLRRSEQDSCQPHVGKANCPYEE